MNPCTNTITASRNTNFANIISKTGTESNEVFYGIEFSNHVGHIVSFNSENREHKICFCVTVLKHNVQNSHISYIFQT